MGRTLLVLALGLALTGCWISEKPLFGPGDYAHLDIAGSYNSENKDGDVEGHVDLTVRPDGLVEGVAIKKGESGSETSIMGFVPIKGGSGEYFILVDRSKEDSDGELYLLGHVGTDGDIEMYWPQCAGTPDIDGMVREKPDFGIPIGPKNDASLSSCTFTTKEALQKAALAAEKFISVPHIVDLQPLGILRKEDGSSDNGESWDAEPGDDSESADE
ncbi:hypothetical protein GRI89_08365 [Altererythrobacter salegens]|uniref:Lipoprotein n=1 Tax=Croceibacterium salegens TaxID=1737568 RepID=A0A6I4SUK8_9SPHN|nr:hypothetical protein [Croceibacterium salegens]MXO59553.1 hypothetical protein [Croceibacterium salegens]